MADKFEFGLHSDTVIKIITHETVGNNFSVELRSNINNPESFNRWLDTFSDHTKTNWIVRSSVPSERSRFAFSKDFVCHHSPTNKISKKDPAVNKNKNCPATLKVRIKRDTRKIRGTDPFAREGLLCSIRIRFEHSHNLDVTEAWGWLKRKDDTRKAFMEYFNKGYSPSEAIHFHEDLVFADRPESLANASINPPKKWVYYLHDIWKRNEFGSAKKDANFFQIAETRLKELEVEGYIVTMSTEPFSIIFVSPLMQRLLKELTQPSLCIFVASATDQTNTSVTVLSTETKAGAVPVAICLHRSQTEEVYLSLFETLKDMWGKVRKLEIQTIMSDDDKALRNALKKTWPEVRLLLSQFHVLQAVWGWLWGSTNDIIKDDRKGVMGDFKRVMYAPTETALNEAQKTLFENLRKSSYLSAVKYFENLVERIGDWGLFCRRNVHNKNTNYAEATFRTLKDVILERLKAYNSLALLDFLTIVLNKYYVVRLLEVAYNRNRSPFNEHKRTMAKKATEICKEKIKCAGNGLYEVECNDNSALYHVDATIGCCTCIKGCQGYFCIHQAAISNHFSINFYNAPSTTPKEKFVLNKIALGGEAASLDIFQPRIETFQPFSAAAPSTSSTNQSNDQEMLSLDQDLHSNDPNLVDNFLNNLQKLNKIVKTNKNNPQLIKAIKSVNPKLEKINSPEAAASFLFSLSKGSRVKFGKNIDVQPTAIARRKDGSRKGSKRVAAGRPKNEISAPKERKRNLALAVHNMLRNAKNH